jgi:hypothetical protein
LNDEKPAIGGLFLAQMQNGGSAKSADNANEWYLASLLKEQVWLCGQS